MPFILALLISFGVNAKPQKEVKQVKEPSVLLFNMTKGRNEFERNVNEKRPIASVTKLMTAMVTLDHDKDLTKKLMLDTRVGSNLPKQKYTRLQLINAMLVRSDNAAAETLANDYPGGRKGFIDAMNNMARNYEMYSTQFEDPTGLGRNNISTASDLTHMLTAANGYWLIRDISIKKQIAIDTSHKKKTKQVVLNNTNKPVLFEFDSVVVSKTGFTTPAGFCLGLVVNRNNQTYAIIILGTKSKQERIHRVQDVIYNHIVDLELKDLEYVW